MKQQRGYVFHNGQSWFVRYRDEIVLPDGTTKRKQVCKKLEVPYGGKYRTLRSVQPFVEKILSPINSGKLDVRSTTPVSEFVDQVYLPAYVEKNLRAASLKQYKDVWRNHLKPRMGKLTLRDFRTVHGEQMLAKIAEAKLSRSSLRHCKAFLSGAFKQAKRLGILDGVNPVQDVSIPRAPEPPETYAYSLPEIKSMLAVLPKPAHTVVLCAAFTGLRKSELRGLTWADFDGETLTVRRSVWNSVVNEPKTRRSQAPIPVVPHLKDALEAHKLRSGILAQPGLPIFQAGNGSPLHLDNLSRRVIAPALSRCAICRKQEQEHKPEAHLFERDKSLPEWHGWHAFRRGLATNLHALGVDDKTIQGILRHSDMRLTMNAYVKSVSDSQVDALAALSEKFSGTVELCNERAMDSKGKVN
jgi:integrase